MKLNLFLLVFSFIFLDLEAQKTELKPFKIDKGIYKTFRSMRSKEPLIREGFSIIPRDQGSIIMIGGGVYTFQLNSMRMGEYKKLQKEIIGISDGDNFYISDRALRGGGYGLSRCILSGPYILALTQGNAGEFLGGGMIPSLIKTEKSYIVNINEGKSVPYTKKFLRELTVKYPELLNEYGTKRNIMDFSIEILEKINSIESKKS